MAGVIDAVKVVVDNTSVIAAVAKGAAHEEQLNAEVAQLVDALRAMEIGVTFAYIASGENPADGISRGRDVTWAEIATGLKTSDGGRGKGRCSRVLPVANEGM